MHPRAYRQWTGLEEGYTCPECWNNAGPKDFYFALKEIPKGERCVRCDRLIP